MMWTLAQKLLMSQCRMLMLLLQLSMCLGLW